MIGWGSRSCQKFESAIGVMYTVEVQKETHISSSIMAKLLCNWLMSAKSKLWGINNCYKSNQSIIKSNLCLFCDPLHTWNPYFLPNRMSIWCCYHIQCRVLLILTLNHNLYQALPLPHLNCRAFETHTAESSCVTWYRIQAPLNAYQPIRYTNVTRFNAPDSTLPQAVLSLTQTCPSMRE